MSTDAWVNLILIGGGLLILSGLWSLFHYRMFGTLISLAIFCYITYWVGSEFGGILGIVFFFMAFVPFMSVPFIIDAAFTAFNAHHRRNDERAIKHLKGEALIRYREMQARVKAGRDEYYRKMAAAEEEFKRTGKPIDREELFGNKNK